MNPILDLSNAVWTAMQTQNIDFLEKIFHPNAQFIHMGATMDKAKELDVIRNQRIIYHSFEVIEKTVCEFEVASEVLTRMNLTAIVNGQSVTNPFVVTEVYVKKEDAIQLASFSFTKIVY